MKKKLFLAITVFALSLTNQAFAADDVLSKLKDLQKKETNTTTDVLLPDVGRQKNVESIPTAAEIKADLADNLSVQLEQLKKDSKDSIDPVIYFKLGIAYELSGDNQNAISSIHKAISLAPDSQQLYQELVNVYHEVKPGVISVFLNGEKLDFKDGNDEVNPVIINGSTLVPIRKISESLGAKVDWNNDTHTATIRLLNSTIQLVQDSTNASVDGNSIQLEVPAQNLNGHILVPLRFISEQFNKKVDYVPGQEGTAIIPIVEKN